jgi:UDP-hydrolysing UDP-N-acetyl-D-glucosamine 2-epimerase
MTEHRKVCVVTGSRAEYGLLKETLRRIREHGRLRLQVVVTGAHMSPEFGSTWREIEADGFEIDWKSDILLSSDSGWGVAKSTGTGMLAFAEAFAHLRPDIVLLLGDRFEILGAASTALLSRIPIAHIHGGESTEGAFDDSIRHAITKMAQWHFVAAETYRQRVIQMGEAPDRVFNVGTPGLDGIQETDWIPRQELEQELAISLGCPLFLITYHPATLSSGSPLDALQELLLALDAFPSATCVFTYANADPGGRAIIEEIERYVASRANHAVAVTSLGRRRYLSLMRESDVVIGNSSSGLIEAPALRKPAVNIGDRQKGRLKASSVLDAAERRGEIASAIAKALTPEFLQHVALAESPYGGGQAGPRIAATLAEVTLSCEKAFFDIDYDSRNR